MKRGRGGLEFPEPARFLPEVTRGLGAESVMEIRARHVLEVENQPALHRDPFDRMLVALAYPAEWVW